MSALLQQVVIPGGALCDPVRVSLSSVVGSFERNGFSIPAELPAGVMLKIDDQKFDFLLKQISSLFSALGGSGHPELTLSYDEKLISFTIPVPLPDRDKETLHSCTEFFYHGFGATSVVPVFIDAAAWSHGARISITGGKSGTLTILFDRE